LTKFHAKTKNYLPLKKGNKVTKLQELKSHLKKGRLYKRAELERWSKSVDRHLAELVSAGDLTKVGPGLYHSPKKNAFGDEPPTDQSLVEKFLDKKDFLIFSYNLYNRLELGTTQLYNSNIVYNHDRSDDVILGNKKFLFRKRTSFPKKLTIEFLLVDLVNNLNELAEDQPNLLENIQLKAKGLNKESLEQNAYKYGSARTRKLLAVA
jgi:hypothetical protein